ncbi:MAG: hypothetical protein ABIO99_11095 [Candidatus Limnocylindria bacterium]
MIRTSPFADPSSRAELRTTAWAVWVPLIVVLVGAVVVTATTKATMRELTQDPTTVLDAPFYIGYVSNLGNVLWAAVVGICAFAAITLIGAGLEWRRFLLWSGVFSAVLLADDLFLLHDEILPRYAGISGELYGISYVAAMAAYLVLFRMRILRTNYPFLLAALVLFGISVVVDLGSKPLANILPSNLVILAEDGSKLLGIGTWLAYFVSVGRRALRSPA